MNATLGLVLLVTSYGAIPALSQQALSAAPPAQQVGCKADRQPLSPAEVASSKGAFQRAADLFQQERTAKPADERLRAGAIETTLALARLDEAERLADTWVGEAPASSMAIVAKAEVELRKGELPAAYAEAARAQKLNPCNGRAYYVLGEYEDMIAMFATEKRHMDLAHALSPNDQDIALAWLALQPRGQAQQAMAQMIATSPILTEEERGKAKKRLAEESEQAHHADCRLTSAPAPAAIPFSAIRYSPDAAPAYGLELAFNGKKRRLELDTGASGLLLTASAAERLGLATQEEGWVGGIGDEGARRSRVAHVAQLTVGSLSFADCTVHILPPRNMEAAHYGGTPFMDEIDGLVGGDLFEQFLLTLDYPGGELRLAPLPDQPGVSHTDLSLATGRREHGRALGTDRTPQDRYRSPAMQDWTSFFRIYHYLLIPTQLNDGPVKLLMADTGAGDSSISAKAARQVTKVSTTNKVAMQGISGSVGTNYLTDKLVLHFGKLYLPMPFMVAFDTTQLSQGAGVEVSGFLGFPVLRQMTIDVDYRDNLIRFTYDPKRKPNPKFSATP